MRFSAFGAIAVLAAIGAFRFHETSAATLSSIQIAAASPTPLARWERHLAQGAVTQISFSPMDFFVRFPFLAKPGCSQHLSGGIIWEDTSETSEYQLEMLSLSHGSTLQGHGLESIRTTDHLCHEPMPPPGRLSGVKIAESSYVALVLSPGEKHPCWYVSPDSVSSGTVIVQELTQPPTGSASPTRGPYTVIEKADQSFIIITKRLC